MKIITLALRKFCGFKPLGCSLMRNFRSVPTSPLDNNDFSDEETGSRNYEADNEREQD